MIGIWLGKALSIQAERAFVSDFDPDTNRRCGTTMCAMDITTRFVRDRLRETPWSKRSYIYALTLIEDIARKGGPKHFPEGVMYHGLCQAYPVENRCIWREIRDGVYTSPMEFRRLVREHERERERERREHARILEEEKRKELQQEQAEREWWLRAGGRP